MFHPPKPQPFIFFHRNLPFIFHFIFHRNQDTWPACLCGWTNLFTISHQPGRIVRVCPATDLRLRFEGVPSPAELDAPLFTLSRFCGVCPATDLRFEGVPSPAELDAPLFTLGRFCGVVFACFPISTDADFCSQGRSPFGLRSRDGSSRWSGGELRSDELRSEELG